MNTLLPCLELNNPDPTTIPEYSIIWLHGLGADGHDFEPIVDELNLSLAIRFIFPHAPEIPVSINNGMIMPAWYDIQSAQINLMPDQHGIKKSSTEIIKLIEREIKRGIKSENIILAGFSQGGAIALHTGLRYEKPLGGIMALSTYLPLEDTLETEKNVSNQHTSIMLAHGLHDQVVPYQLAENTHTILKKNNYPVELHHYPMEHSVCAEEITDISNWIKQRFS